jgi:mono/diheme cytochrome c family protein
MALIFSPLRSSIQACRRHFAFEKLAVLALASLVLFTGTATAKADGAAAADKIHFFETKVRPVLVQHCYECHGADEANRGGDFRLDTPSSMLNGGSQGPAIVKGEPSKSRLVRAIEYDDSELQMPPEGKLSQEEIDSIKQWIQDGAEDPRPDEPVATPHKSSFSDRQSQAKTHWAYQAFIDEPTKQEEVSLGPLELSKEIDKRVARKLAKNNLKFSPLANRRTLIRRLYVDLTGLPPTFDQIEKVQSDKSEDWYERLVTELLDSDAFGERMARRWMDVARYADNKGYVFKEDREYPYAYRYRDWLIRSFNTDLPYDEFLKYQIIADQLDPDNSKGNLDAMGMLTLGRRFLNNKNDIADDRIDVVSRGFLGITVACARCHDHKFDPVSAADYYSLRAAFVGSDEPGGDPSPLRMVDKPKQEKVFVFLRGNQANRGPVVDRKFLTGILGEDAPMMSTGSGRFEIARAMVEDCKTLTARVYVNRLWTWITGQPIVDTPSDFGLRCEAPVQHDVLDLMASNFTRDGWSTKKLIQAIVLSRTYKQQSNHREDAYAIDPENRYFWKAKRRRMDFESFRDALLLATGTLDKTIGGPSVKIDSAPFSDRRTLYAYIDRQNLPSLFRTFDFASPDAHVAQRSETTVPQQGLVLMNSDIMMNLLDRFTKTETAIEDGSESKSADAVGDLFKRILARVPTPAERTAIVEFCKAAIVEIPLTPENIWQYGYGTLNTELNRIDAFKPLPMFSGKSWMGSDGELPDKELGWVSLSAEGGHSGAGLERCAVRRWVAPRDGKVNIRGKLEHTPEKGDGVRGLVIANQDQVLGTWEVFHSDAQTKTKPISIKKGQTIDFVIDAKENANNDGFKWNCQIQYEQDQLTYDSSKHFMRTVPRSLDRWQQAAQMLLLSNEFCFVD